MSEGQKESLRISGGTSAAEVVGAKEGLELQERMAARGSVGL